MHHAENTRSAPFLHLAGEQEKRRRKLAACGALSSRTTPTLGHVDCPRCLRLVELREARAS